MSLISKFKQIDVDDKGSLERQVVVKEVQDLERASYDQVRATLKDVDLDASGRVELEDYVDVRLYADTAHCTPAQRKQCRGGRREQGPCDGQGQQRLDAALDQRGRALRVYAPH